MTSAQPDFASSDIKALWRILPTFGRYPQRNHDVTGQQSQQGRIRGSQQYNARHPMRL